MIFYITKALNGAKTRYTTMERLALAILTSSRKLRSYFQFHIITVLTNHPLRAILHSPNKSGRLTKWTIELSEYDIIYKSHPSAKSQVLADFIIELPPELLDDSETKEEWWTLHVDGSSSWHGSGVRVRLESPTGEILEKSFHFGFPTTNNEAKYEALIAGLRLAKDIGAQQI